MFESETVTAAAAATLDELINVSKTSFNIRKGIDWSSVDKVGLLNKLIDLKFI